MTDIDPRADIELHSADEHVTVRVPLAGAVTSEWLRCYQKLALAAKVPVQAQTQQDEALTMDAPRALIAEADAAAVQQPAIAQVEASVRDWWGDRRGEVPPG